MARLTRKFLTALGIEDENVQDQIVNAHAEATDALKEQRDEYKEAFEKLPKVEDELKKLKEQHENDGENPYQKKYEDEHKAFEEYKKEISAKEAKAAKKTAYKALLKEAGINEKRIDSILKVTDLEKIELDENGKIKDGETLKNDIKTEWADFVVNTEIEGANTATPPSNNNQTVKTRKEIAKIKDTAERQAEYAKLYESGGI